MLLILLYNPFLIRVPDFKGTEDEKLLEQLVESVSQHDDETMIQCCNSGILKSLDPEVL